jgi:uncharacterized short protein YbdD (DUF466 family)
VYPGEPIMNYQEFFRERQDSRFCGSNGKIGRCC